MGVHPRLFVQVQQVPASHSLCPMIIKDFGFSLAPEIRTFLMLLPSASCIANQPLRDRSYENGMRLHYLGSSSEGRRRIIYLTMSGFQADRVIEFASMSPLLV